LKQLKMVMKIYSLLLKILRIMKKELMD
jgi:hypothetical protein